jgi:hypothetical protein
VGVTSRDDDTGFFNLECCDGSCKHWKCGWNKRFGKEPVIDNRLTGAVASAARSQEEADEALEMSYNDAMWQILSEHLAKEAKEKKKVAATVVEELGGKGEANEDLEEQQKLAVRWEQYTKTTVYNKKGQASDKVVLSQTSAPPSEFLMLFEAELRKYAEHKFIAVSQTARRALLAENLTRSMNALLLEMDFSENYEIIHRVEMQSEHWGHQQVTIFMVISHWLEEGAGQESTLRSEAHVFVSSDKNHDTFFVQHVLKHLAESFKDKCFKRWYVDLDGAASHFKSRFTMQFMCELKEKLEKLAAEGDNEASCRRRQRSFDDTCHVGDVRPRTWQGSLGRARCRHKIMDSAKGDTQRRPGQRKDSPSQRCIRHFQDAMSVCT